MVSLNSVTLKKKNKQQQAGNQRAQIYQLPHFLVCFHDVGLLSKPVSLSHSRNLQLLTHLTFTETQMSVTISHIRKRRVRKAM